MLPLISAVFLASLLGSLHCAGMCGAFLAVAVQDGGKWRRHVLLQSAYHGGRLISYLALGVAAGIVGHLLNLGGALAGLRSAAAAIAGATVLAFALITLVRQFGFRAIHGFAPAWLRRLGQRTIRAGMNYPPGARALIIGLSTTFLPCGWLYAFVITAAGTGHVPSAATTMFAFWLGTLPALAALGVSLRTVVGRLGRRLPIATSLVLAVVSMYTIAGRASVDPSRLVQLAQSRAPENHGIPTTAPCCLNESVASNQHDGTGNR
ncbi:MAG TPA: sulfite exporter TauE/SafE family protein [Tepidisphaeraceae bacterium]|nr:sulfite exporter TauE/SafE family protein [Tepidisphaeraceae bacterium]